MIKFIGKIKRRTEEVKQNINKLQNIYFSDFTIPIVYLLFEYNILKTDITGKGYKVALVK